MVNIDFRASVRFEVVEIVVYTGSRDRRLSNGRRQQVRSDDVSRDEVPRSFRHPIVLVGTDQATAIV